MAENDGPGPASDPARSVAGGPDLIPVRMLNEFVYCPRLAHLEWVQGEFQDNADTVEGRFVHRRVDREAGKLPAPTAAPPTAPDDDAAPRIARSVLLSDPGLGLIARIDLVEATAASARPIDFKRGRGPDIEEGAWLPERVQVCAQGLLLRAHGFACDEGELYYAESKRRVVVRLDDDLVGATHDAIAALRASVASGTVPPPLVDSPKCPRCSLAGICLPDEVNRLSGRSAGDVEVRRLGPARDLRLPFHVLEQGAVVGKDGEVLVVRRKGEPIANVRVNDVGVMSLYGNVQVTTQALRLLIDAGVPVFHFSYGGWLNAVTTALPHKNVELRIAQFRTADDPARSLAIARAIVVGKVRNQRTLVRRNHSGDSGPVLLELRRLGGAAMRAPATDTLLGVEGAAARAYFGAFSQLLKKEAGPAFRFTERNRRPPRDPVNALLSFLYAQLARDAAAGALAAGFDPYLGFFHRPRYGRPALALDLAEEFRPLVADSVALLLVNSGEIQSHDFVVTPVGTNLTEGGRRVVLDAYERRMDGLVTHPVFGYPISYRKVLYVQARLLAKHVLGELKSYLPFVTR